MRSFCWRHRNVSVLFVGLLLTVFLPGATTHAVSTYDYLALGDSITFGFNRYQNPSTAANFVGFPDVTAAHLSNALHISVQVTNAACPGENSISFITLTAGTCAKWRAKYPLHVNYSTSQLDYAVAYLTSHPSTQLVTLELGLADLLVLQQQCQGVRSCIDAGLPAVLATLSANLTTIYTHIRVDAHYQHTIATLTYYVPNYNDPVFVPRASAVNQVITTAALAAGATVVDGFTLFQQASASAGGDACAAGLLSKLSSKPLTCDIHPSTKGRNLLGSAVASAVLK